jgi:GNAT superfamily N-acetyltransferase
VHRLLVARAGEQVVGFAAIGPSQDPDSGQATGEVTAIGVHPGARRMGHGSRLLNACVDTLRGAGAEDVATWVLADDEATRAFLVASGLGPDGAYRDRVVSAEGDTLREVRLVASLSLDETEPEDDPEEPESVG